MLLWWSISVVKFKISLKWKVPSCCLRYLSIIAARAFLQIKAQGKEQKVRVDAFSIFCFTAIPWFHPDDNHQEKFPGSSIQFITRPSMYHSPAQPKTIQYSRNARGQASKYIFNPSFPLMLELTTCDTDMPVVLVSLTKAYYCRPHARERWTALDPSSWFAQ